MSHSRSFTGPKKQSVLVILGTRPEAIKFAPIIRELKASPYFDAIVCSTGQHREILSQVLAYFDIKVDIDLQLMQKNQDLYQLTANCLLRLRSVFAETNPSVVLVQGDTTTAFTAALAAFYHKIPVGHVEAGLRTWDLKAPFPEEAYRRMVSEIADFHFAPTPQSVKNLLSENLPTDKIHLTGNTGIDALLWTSEKTEQMPHLESLYQGRKMILMTAHRRENFGAQIERIFEAVRTFARAEAGFQVVYPVHPNPNITEPANRILGDLPNVSLIAPVAYDELVFLLKNCHLVATDSGGVQEEAPSFGKPILVFRESTERPEAVEAGCARLVGSDPRLIFNSLMELSSAQSAAYRHMSTRANPFGDGTASKKIVRILEQEFCATDLPVVSKTMVWPAVQPQFTPA